MKAERLVDRFLSFAAIAVGADFDELSRAASCRECAMYRAWPAASSAESKALPQMKDLKQQFGNNLLVPKPDKPELNIED